MHWKDRIRQERMQRNWRQRDLAEQVGTSSVTVARWEKGQQRPSAYFRLKLCALFGKSAEELGLVPEDAHYSASPETETSAEVNGVPLLAVPDSPELWNVPYPRNPFFTGREDLLRTLHEQLNREHRMALTQSWAISGLGGIGKTQIALEYAYLYREDYRAVFWLSAASRETLLAGMATVAGLLQLPEKEERDQQRVLQAIRRWLNVHQGWLLILDNADDLSVISDVVPTEPTGHLLLTTRVQALGALAQRIEVETMGMAEGTLFLLRRAKVLAPEALLDQASHEQLANAEALVIEMDFLPLALDQAGAYIEEVGCSLSAYLELYRTHRKELLQRRGHAPSAHPEPVGTTWSLSFQKIEQAHPAAAELLSLCAFLEPDAIPEELISEGAAHLGPVLGPVVADTFRLNEAIETLRAFSLVQRDAENRLLRVHRLVQAVLKDTMEEGEQRQWAERAVRAINVVFPETVEMSTWVRCRRYLPQAQACSVLIQEHSFTFADAAFLLYRTACYLENYGLYKQAELLAQQAVYIWEHTQEQDHSDVARALNKLGKLYGILGKYKQAEPLLQQALYITEQAAKLDHTEMVRVLNNLSSLYLIQGKYIQVESLAQRALRIIEHTRGLDHTEMINTLIKLAALYYQQGKYEQAEPLFEQILITEQAVAPDHPNIASALNNLGEIYRVQGKYEQAEPLFLRALRVWETALGPNHSNISFVLNGLSELYLAQGKYEQTEPLLRRALRITEQAQGSDHFQVAHSLHKLAKLYHAQNKLKQAEPSYQQTLHIREQALGPQHPDTAETLHDFAILREDQGELQEAASMYQRALAIREQVLGAQHSRTNDTRERLCAVLLAMGKMEEAAGLDPAGKPLS